MSVASAMSREIHAAGGGVIASGDTTGIHPLVQERACCCSANGIGRGVRAYPAVCPAKG